MSEDNKKEPAENLLAAEELLQNGEIKTEEEYLDVMQNGPPPTENEALRQQKMLENVVKMTYVKLLNYMYENKNNITRSEMMKVFAETLIHPMKFDLPPEFAKLMLDEESCSDKCKDLLALGNHIKDCVYNIQLRQLAQQVADNTEELEKEKDNE